MWIMYCGTDSIQVIPGLTGSTGGLSLVDDYTENCHIISLESGIHSSSFMPTPDINIIRFVRLSRFTVLVARLTAL